MIKSTKKAQIKRSWHLVDAEDQILGRLATGIVPLLLGKNKPYYVSHLDCGDHVVVVNAVKVKLTGRKEAQKRYTAYSGYPGGLKITPIATLREKSPEKIIELAVRRMLPNNKLRSLRLNKLHIFAGPNHRYQDKFATEKKPQVKKKKDA